MTWPELARLCPLAPLTARQRFVVMLMQAGVVDRPEKALAMLGRGHG